MTRDEAWVRFAAAGFSDIDVTASDAAEFADAMLAEYDKRWERVKQVVDVKPIAQPMRSGNPDLRGNEK